MSVRVTVLVADGDAPRAKSLSEALAVQDWDVVLARDAVSATAAVLRQRPAAVILSHQLAGGGASLTLRRIRASVHTALTKVVAITEREDALADALRNDGVDHCFTCPVDVDAIATWLAKALAHPGQVLEAPASIIRDPERVASLERTGLLDSKPSDNFDTLTRVAASLLDAPVALVSLVDRDRQFFKSQFGLPEPVASVRETPLTQSFCQWVVSDHDALVVNDARDHPVLRHNRPFQEFDVVAYAGIPLTPTTGDPIGSFCAVDMKPRDWTIPDLAMLKELAKAAEACIAVEEFNTAQALGTSQTDAPRVDRRLVMQALAEGIPAVARLLGKESARVKDVDRLALLKLTEWFGHQMVIVASASNWVERAA